jgi:hypothetical protein
MNRRHFADEVEQRPPRNPEHWLPVKGFEGLYEVSDAGRVRRLVFINGNVRKPYLTPRILKTTKWSTGYLVVDLCKDNAVSHHAVHRLVLTAFAGPCPEGMVAAHGNGKRDDPRLANLRWATWCENETDKRRHGTDSRGHRNPAARLTEAQVRDIRRRRSLGERPVDLAREHGVSKTTIGDICSRRIWKHVA